MSLRIRLLGRPALEREGAAVRLEGRKTWALLAYVLLESRAPTRRALVDRLWPDADDPHGALRWALSQVRKALASEAAIEERDDRLVVTGTFVVDALELLGGRWSDQTIDDVTGGELLEGSEPTDAPEFERWLSVQRARVATARTDALRSTAASCLRTDPLRALRLAERALAREPFDDGLHELVVECYAQRGDMAYAARYVDATTDLYRRELGAAAPKGLRRALGRTRTAATVPLLRLDLQARALLATAMARSAAGAWDDARDVTTRAIDAAAASGDRALEARGILSFLNIATCRMSRGEAEWSPLLQRAATLGAELGDAILLCDVEIERGRLAAIGARFGAAEAMLRRALADARALGDDARAGAALRYIGMVETERGDESAADAHLRAAIAQPQQRAAASAYLGRLLALAGRHDEVEELVDDAALWSTPDALVWHPLVIVASGDGSLARGDLTRAAERYGSALTFARETQDPDWTALALRGLAQVDLRDGRPERAATMLRQALDVVTTHRGARRWNEALVLADLVELEAGGDRAHVERGLQLARTAPMPVLEPRFAAFARSHTPAHTLAS